MTSKFSRVAMIAGIAIGATGLVAVPAEAANSVSTVNYYVNNPAIGTAGNLTPESATVSASIDTGGNFESLLPVSSSGLVWSPIANITVTAEKWNDGTASTQSTTGNYAPVDGIPVSGSSSPVSVTITDAAISNGGVTDPGIGASSGVPQPISNGGADSYSDTTFEYDPVSDYTSNGDLPGPETNQAPDVQVPTAAGLSSVSATIGAFGVAAQNNTGNTPLIPGTKYYYWVVQQAGATDAASNIDVAAWVGNTSGTPAAPANNSYKCYPNNAIAADPTLASYTAPGAVVNYGGQSLPADQGPCIYYYGNTGGALYYQSPNGTFTTPAIGSIKIGAKATVSGSKAMVTLSDKSAYKAAGTLDLLDGKKLAGTVKFSIKPESSGSYKIKLTAKGKKALAANAKLKVAAISQTATIASISSWDQPFTGKSVKL